MCDIILGQTVTVVDENKARSMLNIFYIVILYAFTLLS